MPFTLAVLADLHLPAVAGAAQEACLDWALAALSARPVDLLVVAGDVTAAGSARAAAAFRAKLDQSGLPCVITPGNSDLRSPDQCVAVRQSLQSPSVADHPECRMVLVDTSTGAVPLAARAALSDAAIGVGDRALVVVTHVPPEFLPPDSREWFAQWAARTRPALIISAHTHRDQAYEFGGASAHTVRGLDPDKAVGGPPALALFMLDQGAWHRHCLSFPGGDVSGWTPAERVELRALLGLACPDDPVGGLRRAAEANVACVELRATAAATAEGLPEALAAWRAAGGRWLSWHMPDVPAPDADATAWSALLNAGLRHDLQAVTVHVPTAPVRDMQPGTATWERQATTTCALLAPAVQRGVRVHVENMHMTTGESPDDSRRHGYLPDECLAWLAELRARLGAEAVHLLLDVGHARNNDPFASEFTLGAWTALVGRDTGATHVHQVEMREGRMTNHQPITHPYGPLISFSSFLWGWHVGQLHHGPVLIEVRGADAQMTSLRTLRGLLDGTLAD